MQEEKDLFYNTGCEHYNLVRKQLIQDCDELDRAIMWKQYDIELAENSLEKFTAEKDKLPRRLTDWEKLQEKIGNKQKQSEADAATFELLKDWHADRDRLMEALRNQ